MGRDKALVVVDGRPLAGRVADALAAAGAGRVEAIGGDPAGLAAAGLATRADRWPAEGPLGGVLTALGAPGTAPLAAVLACDHVAPDPETVRAVVDALASSDADVAVPVTGGRHQWLHAAWRRDATSTLAGIFADGERSVGAATAVLRVLPVTDLSPAALRDADRPGDLPAAPRIAAVQVPAIDIPTLRERLEAGAVLVDVRQPDEYEEARAPGARLIPLTELVERADEVPTEETVYVICRSGGRSLKAAEHLRSRGVDAVNVEGGTLAWIEAGNPVDAGA